MVDITIASRFVDRGSSLGGLLGLLGNTHWLERRAIDAVDRARRLLVVADPAPLCELEAVAREFRQRGYTGATALIAERAPDLDVARVLNGGVDLVLPIESNGWYLLAALHAFIRRALLDERAGQSDAPAVQSSTLTASQRELLRVLVGRSGAWVTKAELSVALTGHPPRGYDDTTIRVHVHRLRRALGEAGALIESKRNIGWRWIER